jgi:tetratricopeptide (TPR) repeat protein
MKKINGFILVLLAAALLATVNTGCSAKAKKAYYLHKANRYFEAGQYDQAEIEYLNALRNDHENALAIGRLGTIYFNEGRLQQAVPFLLKGCELATNDLELRLKLGSFYLVAGKLKEARAEADFVLARNPQDDQAPLLLVAAAETPKGLEETRQRLQALTQKADGAALEIALGSIALRYRDFQTAEPAFKRAQTLNPKLSAVWSGMASLYLAQTNLIQAESALKTAAELAPVRAQEKIQYAEFKFQTGDPAAGRRILEEMVQKTPDYIPAWMVLVKVAAAEKKYDECAALLDKVLARDPDNFNALMSSGQLKLSQGKTAEATAEFERMAKLFAQAPGAHYQLAVAYLAGNETDKAVASLNKAVALDTNFSEAILLLDELEIKTGNAAPAIVSLKKLAQQFPQAAQVQLLLADAYRARGTLDDALAIYRQMEALYPTNFQIPLLMGATFSEQKNNGEARKELTKALELAPDNFTALEQLVNLDVMEKQYAAALQRVQAQLAKNPGLAGLQILQAQILIAQGDAKQAEAALLKLVQAQPDIETAYMLLARLYMDSKQNQKALAELNIATAKNPKNETALLISGMIYSDEKDYKAARDAYEKLLLINPKSSPALNNLAYLDSENLDDLDRAYELAQRARELNSNDPSSSDTLGWILCKRGQYSSAAGLLQESANQLPGEPEVQFHLGWDLYMMGQESPAQLALQRALQSGKAFLGHDECNQCLAVLAVDPKIAGADAVARLEKRVAGQPGDSIALIRLAAIYQRDGAVDKAVAAYESALKANPKNVSALINLAQLYVAKKNPQKAVDLAKAAYKLAPDNSQVSLILGRLAYETGDYKLSLNLLQEAARNESSNPEVLFDFAKAAYAMGQVPEAETAMRGALQTGGAFAEADEVRRFLLLTALAANFSQNGSAAAQVEAILKSEPDYAPALIAMAGINEQKNDVSAARQNYLKVLSRYPNFAPAQRRLAILCAENIENDPQAYEFASKARTAYPDDPAVAKSLGIILYNQAEYARAERILKESADKLTADSEVLYYLGMAQYHLKKPLEVKKSLQKALTLNNLPSKFVQETKRVLAELK